MANNDYIIVGVVPQGKLCPRCGQQHNELVCIPFGKPVVIQLPGMTEPFILNYYARCPRTHEPILVSIQSAIEANRPMPTANIGVT